MNPSSPTPIHLTSKQRDILAVICQTPRSTASEIAHDLGKPAYYAKETLIRLSDLDFIDPVLLEGNRAWGWLATDAGRSENYRSAALSEVGGRHG